MSSKTADHIVLGGGLGGLACAYALAELGSKVVLIDRSLPEAKGALGGFTRFSGAKFSLLPAGQGLMPVAGGLGNLRKTIDEVLNFCGLGGRQTIGSEDVFEDKPIAPGTNIRTYESIVLTPYEIEAAVQLISDRVRNRVHVVDAGVNDLRRISSQWVALGSDGEIARAPVAIFAGGRTGGSLLKRAGAIPQEGKGVDLGIRVEFLDRRAISSLRAKGPDAKILAGKTRTFCLNCPGTVFRYSFRDISIPGGIVADQSEPSGNFGILARVRGKDETVENVLNYLRSVPKDAYEAAAVVRGPPFQNKMSMLQSAYGSDVAGQLQSFGETMGTVGLVDWNSEHRIHFPLLDWHWDTFGVGHSHRTTEPNLFVAGDSAGHARGLLQAGVSGWLAANEALAHATV
ncbi:FAD-binding protein [Mesorhizobium sp. M0999]|uniref:FAD-binding protein n=1 Tax=Mesorhizobium sp. M0999 TaxID=2957045 RepID=UPI0033377B98